jgi:hypothetical protein
VPNQPKTPTRTVRVPDEEWVPALERARENDETVTDVVRRALREYVTLPPPEPSQPG